MHAQNSREMMHMSEYKRKQVLRTQSSGLPSSTNQDGDKPAVRDLLVYYARHSTMHGIPSIVASRLYRGRRLFWCFVVCVMAVLLVTVIFWQMSDFYRYPTVTRVNVHYVTEQDFPAVTICDLNIFSKMFVSERDDRTQHQLAQLTEVPGLSKVSSILRIMEKLTPNNTRQNRPRPDQADSDRRSVESILKAIMDMITDGLYCSWGDFHWENCSVGLTTRVTEMGVCFTVDTRRLYKKRPAEKQCHNNNNNNNDDNSNNNNRNNDDDDNNNNNNNNHTATERGGDGTGTRAPGGGSVVSNALRGLSLVVTADSQDIPYRMYQSEGFKVVLHDHREDPLPKARGFVIGHNCTVEVEIAKNVRIGLEKPFMAFGTGTCVDVEKPGFVNPLKRYDFYTKEACETECFIDSVIKICQCRHFLHPGTLGDEEGNETLCSLQTLKKCFQQAEAYHYGGGVAKEACQCPMPCRQNVYSSGVSSASFRNTALLNDVLRKQKMSMPYGVTHLHLYFPDPVVTTIEQVPVYTLEGLLGSIGGQVGLFMGFSLVTVAEMCELIFLLCTRSRHMLREETRQVLNDNHHHVR